MEIKKTTIFFTLVVALLSGAALGGFLAFTRDLPQIRNLEDFNPSAVTRIYATEGTLLSELFVEKRLPVPLEVMPKALIEALLATEDRNFYKHIGVDIKGIARAIVHDVRERRFAEGASTITQQLSKTLFLTPRKTIVRKIREAILALQLERRYTKDEILALYLNQIYLGSGAYGVEMAAQIYFGKSVRELGLTECALIAGLPQAPSRYSPLNNPERAVRRRNLVLKQMAATASIDAATYERAIAAPVGVIEKSRNVTKAPYFIDHIKQELEGTLGWNLLYKGGLTIHTTLSAPLQQSAEEALQKGLAALIERMRRNGIEDPDPQAALVCLDVKSGGILALVGGQHYGDSAFNRATRAKRQPGSAFKPIVYATAIEKGYPQNQLLLDAPVVFKGGQEGQDWRPENFSKGYQGEISLRRALTQSENIPAVRLIDRLGPPEVVAMGHRLGIESQLRPNLSLALGTSEVSLMELTAAYATFPNQGQHIRPYGITQIENRAGQRIWQIRPQKKIVMSRDNAAIMTDLLSGVIKEGTGRKAQGLHRPLAGKTGTTSDFKDALFIGFSPDIALGVWVGRDAHTTLGEGETGSKAALPIWIDVMQRALAEAPFRYFDVPDELSWVWMDPNSGEIVGRQAPGAVRVLMKREHLAGSSPP